MPELPEVETIKNQLLDYQIDNEIITSAHIFWPKTLSSMPIDEFKSKVIGQKIISITRRAKYLVFRLNKFDLIIHLRMTGQFSITETLPKTISHERAALGFNDRYLIFKDVRKFGRWQLVDDHHDHLKHIGLEPLSNLFNAKFLKSLLNKHQMAIKPLLLNQQKIAGIGNIYADESLWMSHIQPQRTANSLNDEEVESLRQNIQIVLKNAIQKKGSSLGSSNSNYRDVSGITGKFQNNFNVYGQEGKACKNCSCPIKKIKFAQRGTHFCPSCQK